MATTAKERAICDAIASLAGAAGPAGRTPFTTEEARDFLREIGDSEVGSLESLDFPNPQGFSFHFGGDESPNVGNPPDNYVFHIGYNISNAGVKIDSAEPAIYDSWEANWYTAGDRWVERHWQYVGADGTTRRPLSLVVDRATHQPVTSIAGKFVVLNEDQTEQRLTVLQAAEGVASAINVGSPGVGCPIRFDANNTVAISQLNAAGSAYVAMLKLDASNDAVVGGDPSTNYVRVQAKKGMVLPLLTSTARDALTPTAGTTIYNTDTGKLNFYNGSAWEAVTSVAV